MHPLLGIGLLLVAAGVFADALGVNPNVKTIHVKPKPAGDKSKKKDETPPNSGNPPASDSEE